MSTSQKIGTIEAIALIVIIIINQIILNLPNTIITSTGSSSWLNVIYITIIAIILLFDSSFEKSFTVIALTVLSSIVCSSTMF